MKRKGREDEGSGNDTAAVRPARAVVLAVDEDDLDGLLLDNFGNRGGDRERVHGRVVVGGWAGRWGRVR